MQSIHEFFLLGMKRVIPDLLSPPMGYAINLGPGNQHIPGTTGLDLPEWNAEKDPIPFGTGTVGVIHAYHFLEHINNIVPLLVECQRVLMRGGLMNIVVPHAASHMQDQDITHVRRFNEDTWKTLFKQPYYDTRHGGVPWEFDIHFNVIMGINYRNLGLLTQLVRH